MVMAIVDRRLSTVISGLTSRYRLVQHWIIQKIHRARIPHMHAGRYHPTLTSLGEEARWCIDAFDMPLCIPYCLSVTLDYACPAMYLINDSLLPEFKAVTIMFCDMRSTLDLVLESTKYTKLSFHRAYSIEPTTYSISSGSTNPTPSCYGTLHCKSWHIPVNPLEVPVARIFQDVHFDTTR